MTQKIMSPPQKKKEKSDLRLPARWISDSLKIINIIF